MLCATAARIGTADSWNQRIALVRDQGLEPLLEATAERWFTPAFRTANPQVVADILARFARVSPEGYAGCCAALAGADLRAQLKGITVPVLAISGADDPVCPPGDLQAIADGVADGRHRSLPGRHIVNIESAPAFNAALRAFLES